MAYKNFDMVDFRNVTDYFLSYGYTPPKAQKTPKAQKIPQAPATPKAPAKVERVKGVRINCLGDVKMLKRPQFEEIELLTTDVIFTEHDTSDIADRIGIPILTRRSPPDPKWANSKDAMFENRSLSDNQNAMSLHQCCDPSAKPDPKTRSLGWGWCSAEWRSEGESAIVVRKDKKPLLPIHIEALVGYCLKQVLSLLAHSLGEYSQENSIKRDDVLKVICWAMFLVYRGNFMAERGDCTTRSPYAQPLW